MSKEKSKTDADETKETISEQATADEEIIFNEGEDPIEIEQDVVSQDPETLQTILHNQKQEIAQLQSEIEGLNNQVLRAKADYDNLRRRTNEEKVASRKYRAQEIVENILPVIDNFERALAAATENEETKALRQGMDMVYRQLVDALEKEGVEDVQTVGETFDPNIHQAVVQVESEEFDSNIIVEVLQKGYVLNGRVIRPAMVKVSS